jgi:hypothetical protein
MKKILFFILAIGTMFSCQKKETDTTVRQQEVTFSAIKVDPSTGLKSDWLCPTDDNGNILTPTVAKITITGKGDFWPQVFTLDGNMYTQAIKLDVNPGDSPTNYTVEFFGLYTEVDGTLIMATPTTGAEYAEYTTSHVSFNFSVSAFSKAEIPVEVLCYMPDSYDKFGFNWAQFDEIVIREQCFFGDICFKHPADYIGSNYENQSTGLQIDMPAIFKINALKMVNQVWTPVPNNEDFTNDNEDANWGVGAPVCVRYPDNLSIDRELFKFELWVLVKVGNVFEYLKFHEWEFEDDQTIDAGEDGVVDFVLGSCNLSNTDLQLPPYMNLPETCTVTTINHIPGIIPLQDNVVGYFDVTLSDIGDGYDISNISYGVNCFNRQVTIALPETYTLDVRSSLYPEFMTGPCKDLSWDKANWLINHLNMFPGYTWSDIQQAFWKIEDPTWNMAEHGQVPAGTAIATAMYLAAAANGEGYVPLPGGWAGVALESPSGVPATQCIFLRIDP